MYVARADFLRNSVVWCGLFAPHINEDFRRQEEETLCLLMIDTMSSHRGRIKRELDMLANDPGPGVSGWPIEDNMMNLEAQIQGPQDSPYEEGTYTLNVQLSDRYPLEPPRVRFITPIYHPNIDSDGRICLDTLKMQPQGTWSPCININTLLLTIRVLMASPNPDDGLVPDITEEYKRDPALWRRKALIHARQNATVAVMEINRKGKENTKEGGEERSVLPADAATSYTRTGTVGVEVNGYGNKREREEREADKQEDNDEDDDDDDDDDDDEYEEEEDEEEEVLTSLFADPSSSVALAGAAKKSRF